MSAMKIKAIAPDGIIISDVRESLLSLPERSVHCVVTSPPYWSLRSYLPKDHPDKPLEIGSEPTMQQHIETMVEVMRGVKRVLRDDGTVWFNYGDVYSEAGKTGGHSGNKNAHSDKGGIRNSKPKWNLPQGSLALLPHRIAIALQADGWIVRAAIIWAKGISFRSEWSGSVMPESVQGVRWEKCRVKGRRFVGGGKQPTNRGSLTAMDGGIDALEWSDCPGCPKCEKHGGYVLRRGSWRPTSAYEMVFMLAKTSDYYCDGEAVKEDGVWGDSGREDLPRGSFNGKHDADGSATNGSFRAVRTTRNLRNVWGIGTSPSDVPHYATYPEQLVEPCIKAGTSDKGVCPHCGDPWARIIDKRQIKRERPNDRTDRHEQGNGVNSCGNTVAGVESTTIGWKATCDCLEHEPAPATVLDIFGGSGTTAIVARKLGRRYIICELNETYADIARKRIGDYAPLFASEGAAPC